jgi:SAM-dependent methyltransferase
VSGSDRVFAGSVPQIYERLLVPLIFEPYAVDLADRVAALEPRRVLEVAAGTGVVTRNLARKLGRQTSIVATDLNPGMLDQAAAIGTARPVDWRTADAMQLPFPDASFDVIVCQFGVMFFPDKAKAFAEARRVLAPSGHLAFNVWDRIEDNEFADCVTRALGRLFPDDPPRFLARTPHGYHDRAVIENDLARGGFTSPASIATLAKRSRADSPATPSTAYCHGTPLRNEIEARAASRLDEGTSAGATEIAKHFGNGSVDGKIQAHVVVVQR